MSAALHYIRASTSSFHQSFRVMAWQQRLAFFFGSSMRAAGVDRTVSEGTGKVSFGAGNAQISPADDGVGSAAGGRLGGSEDNVLANGRGLEPSQRFPVVPDNRHLSSWPVGIQISFQHLANRVHHAEKGGRDLQDSAS